jgi:hypothetical protein
LQLVEHLLLVGVEPMILNDGERHRAALSPVRTASRIIIARLSSSASLVGHP